MYAIKQEYDDLPATIILPQELVHRRAEIIIIMQDDIIPDRKHLSEFSGVLPDFPERFPQGIFEKRGHL